MCRLLVFTLAGLILAYCSEHKLGSDAKKGAGGGKGQGDVGGQQVGDKTVVHKGDIKIIKGSAKLKKAGLTEDHHTSFQGSEKMSQTHTFTYVDPDPLSVTFGNGFVTDEVTLTQDTHTISRTFKQVKRPQRIFTKAQVGAVASSRTDEFVFGIKKLDVLLVIDSNINDTYLNKLAALQEKLNGEENLDWAAAVIGYNSFPQDGCDISERANSSTSAEDFKNILRSTKSDMGYRAAAIENALKVVNGECGDDNWIREDAGVSLIFMSMFNKPFCLAENDDGTYSFGIDTACNAYVSELVNLADEDKIDGMLGIFAGGAEGIWTNMFNHSSNMTSANYDNVTTNVSRYAQMATDKNAKFTLAHTPSAVTEIKVSVGSDEKILVASEYSLNENVLRFDQEGYTPEVGATIAVSYAHGDVPFDTEWTLQKEPVTDGGDEMIVFKVRESVGGSVLHKLEHGTDYTVNGKVVQLSDASKAKELVPEGSQAVFIYRVNRTLKTDFALGLGVYEAIPAVSDTVQVSVQVLVNAVEQDANTYSLDDNYQTLTFQSANAPASSATIELEIEVAEKTLTYDLGFSVEDAESIVCAAADDIEDNLDCTYADDQITFTDVSQFVDGKAVLVTASQEGYVLHLDEGYVEESIAIHLKNDASVSCDRNDIKIDAEGKILSPPSSSCIVFSKMSGGEEAIITYDTAKTLEEGYRAADGTLTDDMPLHNVFFADHEGDYNIEYYKLTVNGDEKGFELKITVNGAELSDELSSEDLSNTERFVTPNKKPADGDKLEVENILFFNLLI